MDSVKLIKFSWHILIINYNIFNLQDSQLFSNCLNIFYAQLLVLNVRCLSKFEIVFELEPIEIADQCDQLIFLNVTKSNNWSIIYILRDSMRQQ